MYLFTKENAYGLVRTSAAFVYAWLLTLSPDITEIVADLNISVEFFVLLFGSILYQLIRWIAERLPWVGYLLVFNKKPDYHLPEPELEQAA